MLDFDRLLHAPVAAHFGEKNMGAQVPTFTAQDGTTGPVDGVYDDAYETVDLYSGLPANTTQVVFGAALSAFPTPPQQNDQLYVPRADTTYLVAEVRPDGHGWVQLRLNAL